MTDIKTGANDSDARTLQGGNPNDNRQIVTTDQTTIGGDGSVERPLRRLGGGGTGVDIQDEGVFVRTATTINLVGNGVEATDGGAGVADVAIPGGVIVEQDGGNIFPGSTPTNVLNMIGIGAKPIGISVGDTGALLPTSDVEIDLSADSQFATFGQPATVIDINKWIIQLNNAQVTESVAPFSLPTPGPSVIRDITLVANSNSPVSVSITDFIGAPRTFISEAIGDSIRLVAVDGVWYLVGAPNGFGG